MCVFSFDLRRSPGVEPVRVSTTRIFARGLPDGSECLAYQMRYTSAVDVAMVLPLPTPPGPPEDAVEFIDLSDFGQFFACLDHGFPERPAPEYETFSMHSLSAAGPPLAVHEVGSFEASFVPAPADFRRLDERFRLPDAVLDQLPIYRDFGFAVFKLKPGKHDVHPMAFRFPRRNPKELFFPTVHAHDGTVPKEAHFDHVLYCQSGGRTRDGWETSRTWKSVDFRSLAPEDWERIVEKDLALARGLGRSEEKARRNLELTWESTFEEPAAAGSFFPCARAHGLVDPEALLKRVALRGKRQNADIVKAEPARVS